MAIDLPGHGMSSHRPPGSLYSTLDYLADVKYVIDGEYINAWYTLSDC